MPMPLDNKHVDFLDDTCFAGVAERAQTWGGHFRILICVALSAALRATSLALVHRCISGSRYNDKLTIDVTRHPQDHPPLSFRILVEESRESFVQSVIKVGYKVEW